MTQIKKGGRLSRHGFAACVGFADGLRPSVPRPFLPGYALLLRVGRAA
jgi:hypothetical protein